jgi:hypothetical protein
VPKSIRVSPHSDTTNRGRRSKTAPDSGSKLPGIRFSGSSSPLPSLLDWQRKDVTAPTSGSKHRTARSKSSSALAMKGVLPLDLKRIDDLSLRQSSKKFMPSSSSILSPSTRLGATTSPGERNSPPGLGRKNSPVYHDAGRSHLFAPKNSKSLEHMASPGSSNRPHAVDQVESLSATPSRLTTANRTEVLNGGVSLSGAKSGRSDSNSEMLAGHGEIHPCFGILVKSWQNRELFAEFAGGSEEDQVSLLKNLSQRKELLDFSELLDLLRSLQLLCPRGTIFNPVTQVSMTRAHEIFEEINIKKRNEYITTSGLLGERNVFQFTFEEYKFFMLCVAHCLQAPLQELVPPQEKLDRDREELIEAVKETTHKARMKSIERKPGTMSFLARMDDHEGVKAGYKNVQAAREACNREEFDQARAHAQYASNVFLQNLRPDLLCEIRLVEQQIARDQMSAAARKKKSLAKIELELQEANHLSRDLKIDAARGQIMKAMKMSEAARLQISKGTLRRFFKEAEEFLEQGSRAIEGDKKLAQAWRAVQRDELKDARVALKEAQELHKGVAMRKDSSNACEEALQRKSEHEEERKERGRALMKKAVIETEQHAFEQAHSTIEEARKVFMEWTVPIGKNQLLTEHTTSLFQKIWQNEELYQVFCAFDMDNLSGAGVRAMDMDFNELLQMLRSLGILLEQKTDDDAITNHSKSKIESDGKKMPKSRSLELERRQKLVDACTSPEIKRSERVKITKADVYTEFRAVNRMSQLNLVQGNLDADDDVSSLDWGEYKILIMRIAKHLDVPVTDIGCSPLFIKDIDKVDALQLQLNKATKDYMNGIVASGEAFIASSRVAVQDKRFDDAIEEVHKAEAEFRRVWEEKVQMYQLFHCNRQLEVIEKERTRENHRRAEQKLLGERALKTANELLDQFVQQGALFDEFKFADIEKEALNAQKHFKSASAFSSEMKQRIVKILNRTTEDKEKLVRLRQGVTRGLKNIEDARNLIQDMAQTSSGIYERSMSTSSSRPISSSANSTRTMSSPANSRTFSSAQALTQNQTVVGFMQQTSPFDKPLKLLAEAKDLLTTAKVSAEFKELVETFLMLVEIAISRKNDKVKQALAYVQVRH